MEKWQVSHCISRWLDLAHIWFDRQAVIQRRELSEQIEYLDNYTRFLQKMELTDGVVLCTVAIGAVIAVFLLPLPKALMVVGIVFVIPLFGVFISFGILKIEHFYLRNGGKFRDFTTEFATTNEIVSRRVTNPSDKVHGIRGMLSKEVQTILNRDTAVSAPQLFQDFFEAVATRDNWSGRLIFCAHGPLREDGPSWVPDLEHSHAAWSQPQSASLANI